MVVIVAMFDGCGWEVVVVGEVGAGAVVPVHPSGGRGFEVVAVLPGAVAPDEFAFVGLVEGLGGGVVVGGAHGSGGGPGSPLGRVVGCRRWTGTAIRGRSGAPAPPGPRPRVPCAPGSRVPGRCPRCRCPVRALVAQPTMRRALRAPVTDAVQRVPRPGRHVGAGRPPICGSGRWRRESLRCRPVGPGPPRRARWRGAFCRGRPPSVPAPACAAPRCTGPPGGARPGR